MRKALLICAGLAAGGQARDHALFLAFDAVPAWARRGPYWWAERRLMRHWHPGLKDAR